jgi:hypothetical protein
VEIRESAHRHGVDDADILHAWANAMRLVEYDYRGEERLLVIGPDRHGRLLEIAAVSGSGADSHHPRRRHTPEVLRIPEMR